MTGDPVMPTAALAGMIPVIELFAIMMAYSVSAPHRIGVLKIPQENRMGPIPPLPFRTVPLAGSDDVGFGIGVIRSPSVAWAEKVIQDAIQEPVTRVIDPGGIGADIGGSYDGPRRGRGRIDLRLGKPRHRPYHADAQENCQD